MNRREFFGKGLRAALAVGGAVYGAAKLLTPSTAYAHPHECEHDVWRKVGDRVTCYEMRTVNVHVSDPTFGGIFGERMGKRIVHDTLEDLGYSPFIVKTERVTPPYSNQGMGLIMLKYDEKSKTVSVRLRDSEGKPVGTNYSAQLIPPRVSTLEGILRKYVRPVCPSDPPQKTIPTKKKKDGCDCDETFEEWWRDQREKRYEELMKDPLFRRWGLGRLPVGGKE